MAIHLPDVNVLIALHDSNHPDHSVAQEWFDAEGKRGWATCPLTENGFVRVFAQTNSPFLPDRVAAAFELLGDLIALENAAHHFWPDVVSLRDTALFLPGAIVGHRQITDVYLLGLCQHMGGTLVTLDDKMSTDAIIAPHSQLLRKL